VLTISVDHLKLIQAHAEQTYPEECCGLLLGRFDRGSNARTLVEVRQTENAWSFSIADELEAQGLTKARRYWIDPQDLLKAQRYARDRQLDIIGIYHSHPDYPAVPSECDRACAWSGYLYLIVAVDRGIAQDLLCWSLDDRHQFQSEALLTVTS
jgi:proteasome lid subunit RPN8/RPN11